jgi:uncharacterized protein YcnI
MSRRVISVLVSLFVLLVASVASAHVTVWPKQSPVNGYERYTIRVPNEKDNPTVKLRVELPVGTTYSAVLPVSGWKFETEKDGSGKVVALDWSGGEIKPGEFLEFGISVRNPKDAADVAFKAYQTYQDGTTVEWTGAAGADKPAPVVTLTPAGAAAPAPSTTPAPAPSTQPAPAPVPAPAPPVAPAAGGGPGTWMGGAALLLSLVALVFSLRKK